MFPLDLSTLGSDLDEREWESTDVVSPQHEPSELFRDLVPPQPTVTRFKALEFTLLDPGLAITNRYVRHGVWP